MVRTVAIDFDGVLSDYRGFRGEHELDPPLAGAIEWLTGLVKGGGFQVVILSSRDPADIMGWLTVYCEPSVVQGILVTDKKVPAWVYIEDRAMVFNGPPYPSPAQIESFRAWWQQ
jgi:hypothetical protein